MSARRMNFIKCKFCVWTTTKWGRGSTAEKAFSRLTRHIGESHPVEADKLEDFRIATEEEFGELEQ